MAVAAKDFDSLNLRGVNLSGLDLTGANFRNANLRRADLSAAKLNWAVFTDADLKSANLTGAQLKKANFTDADLSHANLQDSQLGGAILERACLQGADLNGADLTHAYIGHWKISRSTTSQEISFQLLYKNPEYTDIISDRKQLDAEIGRSQQHWKQIDKALNELYKLKGMTGREVWSEQFSDKAKDLELPLHIFNHLFQKYYKQRLFRESHRSVRGRLLREWRFLELERWLESINYSIAHWDIFPILDKLQTLSIIGALVLLINGLIRVDYESRYRAWEIINTHPGDNIDGGTRLGLQRLVEEGASLENLEAKNAILNGINLRNANLQHANLLNTDLKDADLRNAQLTGAYLKNADLRNAQLTGADLTRTNLRGANLNLVDLSEVDLRGANLMGSDLREATLPSDFLSKANWLEKFFKDREKDKFFFTGVLYDEDTQVDESWKEALKESGVKLGPDENLTEKDFSGRDLSESDLTRANLTGANLTGANLTGANLTGADLTDAEVKNARFGDNLGMSEPMMRDLIERGAIF